MVAGAASLTEAFAEIVTEFQKQHPEIKVDTTFASSDTILQQIIHGAPVDVFAAADGIIMDKAVAKDVVNPASRHDFARNDLVLITPKSGDYEINSVSELSVLAGKEGNLKVAIGNPDSVPAGRYTKDVLQQSGHWQAISQRQITAQNVRQALAYVKTGDVDAGFVFATDALLFAKDINMVQKLNTSTPVLYPIALVNVEKESEDAKAFIDYVLSSQGQTILHQYGFETP